MSTVENIGAARRKFSISYILSILFFIPMGIHFASAALIYRGWKSRVRYTVRLGCILCGLEIITAFFLQKQTDVCIALYIAFYVIAICYMSLHYRQYIERRNLAKMVDLEWISSFKEKKIVLKTINNGAVFIEKLSHLHKEIENPGIKKNIQKIIDLFQVIHKRDPVAAEKFLVLHSTVVKVLTQYDELENTRLDNATVMESKEKLEKVIATATAAIEQELVNQFKNEILDVSAETDAYLQQLKNKNLINDHPGNHINQ